MISIFLKCFIVGEPRRLRSICEELLGPCHKSAKDPGCILVSKLMKKYFVSSAVSFNFNFLYFEQGLPKRQLLKDVLAEISNNVHAQRLYTEFSEQLSYVEEET